MQLKIQLQPPWSSSEAHNTTKDGNLYGSKKVIRVNLKPIPSYVQQQGEISCPQVCQYRVQTGVHVSHSNFNTNAPTSLRSVQYSHKKKIFCVHSSKLPIEWLAACGWPSTQARRNELRPDWSGCRPFGSGTLLWHFSGPYRRKTTENQCPWETRPCTRGASRRHPGVTGPDNDQDQRTTTDNLVIVQS